VNHYDDYQPFFKVFGAHEPRHLRMGPFEKRRDTVTIEKGQNLKLGAILGIKPNGKFVLCAKQNADGTLVDDGSQEPVCYLQIDVDATASDLEAPVYRTGSCLHLDLYVGKGHTLESIKEALAKRCLFIDKGED
jgi:Bacteriophage lambda head decoration protein D